MSEVLQDEYDPSKPWLNFYQTEDYKYMLLDNIYKNLLISKPVAQQVEKIKEKGYTSAGYFFWNLSKSDIENLVLTTKEAILQKIAYDEGKRPYESCIELQQITLLVIVLVIGEGIADATTDWGKCRSKFYDNLMLVQQAVFENKPLDYTKLLLVD